MQSGGGKKPERKLAKEKAAHHKSSVARVVAVKEKMKAKSRKKLPDLGRPEFVERQREKENG